MMNPQLDVGLHDLRLLFNLPEKEVAKQIGESLSLDKLITLTKSPWQTSYHHIILFPNVATELKEDMLCAL
jgi:hypothetical protein